jgi:hypothetical protein
MPAVRTRRRTALPVPFGAKDFARACAAGWRDFGLLPGTRLSLVRTGAGRSVLLSAEQQALASVQYSAWSASGTAKALSRDGRTYTLSRVKKAQWPAVAAQTSVAVVKAAGSQAVAARKPWGLRSLADRTGLAVLYTKGRHVNRVAHGYVEFPGQRWLRFPVRGTTRWNAIMTAVDQAGRQVARYRLTADGVFTRRRIEITIHPDQALTDELILTLALTARWISSFFIESEGGGG